MTDPLSLETIQAEFSENTEAWVLQDKQSKKYVTIPHPKYPGRSPIHFFMSKNDAESVLTEILDANFALGNREIFPVKVKLLQAIRGIAADKTAGNADGFVVHPPNEVFEFVRQQNP
ncbi:MAG: hypothetical protein HY941_11475 [Gammaproteobacteria bacterium]|nr:hypothetical protein [Gammaproteobacteria bacterium]